MGTCFPLVCTVTGSTEREMPTGQEFIHVKVPGLCIGGDGVNINNAEVGHVLLMQNTEGAKKKRFKWYQQEILIPGINDHRRVYGKFDASSGSSIPNKLTAVAYCDGDISQINVIKNSINLFVDNKVIANKQHASRSGVKQPADLARVFKLIKTLLPEHTVKNIPAERCPMKVLMIDAFKNKLDNLCLPSNKTKSLIDFISTLSATATKVCTVKNIQHGFTEAGMLDGDNLRFSVYDKILATCRHNPSLAEYENIEKKMPTIIHHSCEFGHVSDDIYDKLGIIQDREKMGLEVMRDASISQESFQQTKCLTHEHQICLRNKRLSEIQRIESERKEVANHKHQEKIQTLNNISSI